jgi:hypothetical protein
VLTEDLPIAAMLLGGTPVQDVAMTLDPQVDELRRRTLRIMGRLQARNGGAGSVTTGSTSERDGS